MKDQWTFNWLTRWDEVWDPSFVARWQEWMKQDACAHVFFHPAMVKAWTDTYRNLRDIAPRFIIAEQDNTTIFLPLILDKGGWKDAFIRVVQPVGHNEFDYHDPVVTDRSDKDLIDKFWRNLISEVSKQGEFDQFLIPRVREHTVGTNSSFNVIGKAPYLDLSGLESCEQYMSTRSKKMRQNINYQERRMKENNLFFRVFGKQDTDKALAALDGFKLALRGKWPNAYRAPGLLETIIREALPSGILHFTTLELQGAPVSWHMGFMNNRRFYYYLPAYDASVANYSPGVIHLYKTIETAFMNDIEIFDFLSGEEDYKSKWTDQTVSLLQYETRRTNLSTAGRLTCNKILRHCKSLF